MILAVWNGMPYLQQAIDSVLGQTVPPLEIIVVDDGSTDETPALLASYKNRIRVIRQPNAGQAAALVSGIALATGEYLAFQDSDDLWLPTKSELQLNALAGDPALDAVFGCSQQFVSPEIEDPHRQRLCPPHELLKGEVSTCMTLRRSAYERHGGFDPLLSTAYFFDWLGRARAAGLRTRMLDDVVHKRRLHLRNYGRVNRVGRDKQMLATLRDGIARKRETRQSAE